MTFPNLVQAAIDAAFSKLGDAVSPELATVRVTAKQDSKPPIILCGDVDFVNIGSKDAPLFEITLQIQHVSMGNGRAGVIELMAATFNALHDQELEEPDGVALSTPEIVAGGAGATADGAIFAGIQTFKLTSEPA